jgi:G3E family GTPase
VGRGGGVVTLAPTPKEYLCLCCTPRDELETALRIVLDHRASFDRLIVETTGLADPAMLRPLVEDVHAFRVDTVLTVVDLARFSMLPATCPSGGRSLEYEQIALSSAVIAVRGGDCVLDAAALAAVAAVPSYGAPRATLDSLGPEAAAALFGAGAAWSHDAVLAVAPAYFSAAVPFARHQTLLSAGSLVNVQVVTAQQLHAVLQWIRSLAPFWRIKGTLYLDEGRRVILDGAHDAALAVLEGRPWKPTEEIPANKLVFVGCEVDVARLKGSLCECAGLAMQPTVLYSAPPPVVDTPLQRIVLLLLLVLAVGSSWSFQWATVFALLVYAMLSLKR